MAKPKEPSTALRVFLCHASSDKPKVRKLYQYLREHGMQPWLDSEDLLPGQDWQVEIPKAIAASDAIVICLSKRSIDKEGYVQKEIRFALDRALEIPEGRIFLIPARLEKCAVPAHLERYQWVDLFSANGYNRLRKSLVWRAEEPGPRQEKTTRPKSTKKYSRYQKARQKLEEREQAVKSPARKKPGSGKYGPLKNYLGSLPESQLEETLSFSKIESILNDKLPASAYLYQTGLGTEKDRLKPLKQAIAQAGWQLETINSAVKWIRLVRPDLP